MSSTDLSLDDGEITLKGSNVIYTGHDGIRNRKGGFRNIFSIEERLLDNRWHRCILISS